MSGQEARSAARNDAGPLDDDGTLVFGDPPAATALARLREGTEVLRTGGGATLTASECNALLDEIERLRDLVVRFRQWDDLPGRADGPYWMSEADKVLGDA